MKQYRFKLTEIGSLFSPMSVKYYQDSCKVIATIYFMKLLLILVLFVTVGLFVSMIHSYLYQASMHVMLAVYVILQMSAIHAQYGMLRVMT